VAETNVLDGRELVEPGNHERGTERERRAFRPLEADRGSSPPETRGTFAYWRGAEPAASLPSSRVKRNAVSGRTVQMTNRRNFRLLGPQWLTPKP
jgi:hypothetical protein